MRPYTTRKDKTGPLLSLVENNKGWKRNNGDVYESLKDLARDLPEITENATFKRSDISVPSPWASMISFDIILKSNNNDFGALKTCAVNEWRVLLTLIALRDIYKIKLEKYEINISDENDNMADNAFFSNIYSLRPKKTLFSDESWSKFIFLTLDGNEIGAFSNSTLICSNYDYEPSNATKELIKLGFMDKDLKFINPVNILKSDLAMSLYMSLWLEKVKEMIPNKNESADLEGVIDRFIDDLKKSFCGDIVIYNELANNNFFEFGFDFSNDYPANSAELLWNVRIKKMDLTIPQIQSKIKLGKIGKPVFALEPLGANVTNIIDALEENCIKPEGIFLDNNNVFLDKMSVVKFDDKPAFANIFGSCTISEPNGNSGVETVKYSYILPLRKDDNIDIVNILSSDAVREITKITETEDEIIVKMEFELEDGQPCILSKSYLKRECRKLYNGDLPMIAIWPYAVIKASKDSRENKWKDYYIFSAINELNKDYSVKVCGDNNDNSEPIVNKMTRIKDGFMRETAWSPYLPSYLSVKKNIYDYSGALIEQENIGIIVFEKPKIEIVTDSNVKYLVGFDFGTTSTTAFCKRINDNDTRKRFVKIGQVFDRAGGVINHPKDAELSDFAEDIAIGNNDDGCYIAYDNRNISNEHEPETSFIPQKYPKRKAYMSLYKQNTNDIIPIGEENQSLRFGNIIFDQGLIGYIDDGNLVRNLKWGTDDKKQTGYLGQIMKEIAFTLIKENAGSISWRFSYPTSLTNKEERQYRDKTKSLVKYIGSISGIESKLDDIEAYWPESIASAKFKKDYSQNYICLDIGGGSTDISLWKKNLGEQMKNIVQFSVGIASRKIFLAGITDAILNVKKVNISKDSYSLNEIQKQIRTLLKNNFQENMTDKFDNAIEVIKKSIKLNDGIVLEAVENFSYVIEPLLQTNGDTLKRIMETDDDIMALFQQFLLMGFWGILYYLAKTLSCSDFKEMLRDTDTLYINLAGNGSMLYNWVRDYAYELSGSYNKIDDAFTQLLNKFLESDDSSRIKVIIDFKEADLKTEAACGLLEIDEKIDINELMSNNRLINGVKCTLKMKNGDKEPLDEYVSIIDKQHKIISEFFTDPKNSAIDEIIPDNIVEDIDDFVNSLKGIFGDEKSFYTLISDEERDMLRTNFGIALKKNIESGTIAPVFILELEAFLRAKLGY